MIITVVVLCVIIYFAYVLYVHHMKISGKPVDVIKAYYTPTKEDMKRINQIVDVKLTEPFDNYNIVEQLDDTDNAEDYTQIIENMRKKYSNSLNSTVDAVYSASSDVSGDMGSLQGKFDMYGVETMAKTFFDIIA